MCGKHLIPYTQAEGGRAPGAPTKKKLRALLAAALSLTLAVSIAMAARQQLGDRARAASYEKAARRARLAPQEDWAVPAAQGDDLPEDPAAEELAGIDLAALQEVNPDVLGWICIPGTELSYPLLQGDDNDFYLEHTWEKEPNSGGAIYMDIRCAPNFTCFNTILYGHRMRDGSMFATLKYYKDPEFWREHPSVYIALRSGVRVYDVFAAWEPKTASAVYATDFDGAERRQAFLDACMERSCLDTGVTPGPDDELLTLSTCTGRGHATRWVVQCRLAREYPGGGKQ